MLSGTIADDFSVKKEILRSHITIVYGFAAIHFQNVLFFGIKESTKNISTVFFCLKINNLGTNNLQKNSARKFSDLMIYVEAVIYLLLLYLHDCKFNKIYTECTKFICEAAFRSLITVVMSEEL